MARPMRLGIFLDSTAGILCFYWLSDDTRTLLHTFHSTFTEPVYPVLSILGGSLTLPAVEKLEMDHVPLGFTPEVSRERIGISYSFQFPGSGLYRCSLTGLVFRVTHKGEVMYRTEIWDDMLLQLSNKQPGGPLFSIQCPQDCISELQLPHCEPEPALVSDCLYVGHITDDGMSIIQPLKVTETHVAVRVPHLSGFGIILDRIKKIKAHLMKPIRGQVLLFLRHLHRPLNILSVILLPSNVPLQDVKEQHTDSKFIQAPSFSFFHKGKTYSLHSDPDGFTIQPKDRRPRLRKSLSADEKLRTVRPDFIYQVSNPVLNKLLDELQHCRVITDDEAEDIRTRTRSEKARELIDSVRKKGAEASSKMISALCSNDQYLSNELGLL
ncbi:PREDICTED: NACHT, LRR and PYD domains-containing protein 1-like [Cyprinodon variegatus]|uniref:NACHT, LRR and PYD domains-containing protein 1-like n=1 Tax=Cyprinodon variegatus TaxID=28743 RepID=UPI00074295E8|nr:PREDICTED: NACHT, LRR and PYD domains-containing protein 1-like [Cyprinodon variegatus]